MNWELSSGTSSLNNSVSLAYIPALCLQAEKALGRLRIWGDPHSVDPALVSKGCKGFQGMAKVAAIKESVNSS